MDFCQVWPPCCRALMKYPLLYLVYRIKTCPTCPYPTSLSMFVCVRVNVCMYITTAPKGIKAAPLTGLNPKKYPFITLLISPSLFHFHYWIMQFLSVSQRIPLSISVSMNDLSVHTVPVLFYTPHTTTFCVFLLWLSFPSYLCFSHISSTAPPSLTFDSLTIYLRSSTTVITLRKRQSRNCVMRRWVPVEVFIEMGLYRDWSCLRSSCTNTDIQILFPLPVDPLSWTQCILFHGGLVILQRRAIIGICQGPQCVLVCMCVSKKVRQNERWVQRVKPN